MYDVLRHLDLEPLMLFLVALGTVVAIRFIAVQEKIASAGLLMTMVGGVLFASVYVGRGDDSPPADDERWDPPDDPGGDRAYPWWPEFERELRDYERARTEVAGAGVRLRA